MGVARKPTFDVWASLNKLFHSLAPTPELHIHILICMYRHSNIGIYTAMITKILLCRDFEKYMSTVPDPDPDL